MSKEKTFWGEDNFLYPKECTHSSKCAKQYTLFVYFSTYNFYLKIINKYWVAVKVISVEWRLGMKYIDVLNILYNASK